MNPNATHTPVPWKLMSDGKTIVSNGPGKDFVAETLTRFDDNGHTHDESKHEIDAAFIVQACNNFAALLSDAKVNAQWFEDNGYPTEAANIRRLVAHAEENKMETGIIKCAKHNKDLRWIGNRSECAECIVEREIKLAQAIAKAQGNANE